MVASSCREAGGSHQVHEKNGGVTELEVRNRSRIRNKGTLGVTEEEGQEVVARGWVLEIRILEVPVALCGLRCKGQGWRSQSVGEVISTNAQCPQE